MVVTVVVIIVPHSSIPYYPKVTKACSSGQELGLRSRTLFQEFRKEPWRGFVEIGV